MDVQIKGGPKMITQNMFQEGLYQVFVKEGPLPGQPGSAVDLKEARITRWFGAVVHTRILISGVVQVLGGLASTLSTSSFSCMKFGCSISTATPVWAGIFYVATGGLATYVQHKPNKVKVITLMGLNIFSLLLEICSILTYTLLGGVEPKALTKEQRVGAYLSKASSIFFSTQCLLASIYILFLTWRGLKRYSLPTREPYSRISQEEDEHRYPLLVSEEEEDL